MFGECARIKLPNVKTSINVIRQKLLLVDLRYRRYYFMEDFIVFFNRAFTNK